MCCIFCFLRSQTLSIICVCVCMMMAMRSSLVSVAVCVLAVYVGMGLCEPISLRLSGDRRKHYEGRLEVYYRGEWGTVCDDDFDMNAAHVACRQLGYLGAVSWVPSAKYGKGEGVCVCVCAVCNVAIKKSLPVKGVLIMSF